AIRSPILTVGGGFVGYCRVKSRGEHFLGAQLRVKSRGEHFLGAQPRGSRSGTPWPDLAGSGQDDAARIEGRARPGMSSVGDATIPLADAVKIQGSGLEDLASYIPLTGCVFEKASSRPVERRSALGGPIT